MKKISITAEDATSGNILPREHQKIIFDGLMEASDTLGRLAGFIEVVTVKPISLGAAYHNTEVLVVINYPDKVEIRAQIEPASSQKFAESLVREIKHRIKQHCD